MATPAPAADAAGGRRAARSRVRRFLTLTGVLGAVAVATIVVLTLASLSSVRQARAELEQGRSSLERARRDLIAGDATEALDAFRSAGGSFDRATTHATSGALRALSTVPFVGRNVDIVVAVARGGRLTADAGVALSEAVVSVPGGFEALFPKRGRIPLERFDEFEVGASRALESAREALLVIRRAPSSRVLPVLGRARTEAEDELVPLVETLTTGTSLLGAMPTFLGADGPRRYFFGAENPAELRGTGGLIGAYSLLRASDGELSFSPFRPIQTLRVLPTSEVEPPNEDYARLYDPQRQRNGFWLNVNMTPDFPSAAIALERAFEASAGTAIDGVITADPIALEALLRVTGPAPVPHLDREVTADTVVALLANEAYAEIRNPTLRKRVLGSVAESVVTRFLTGDVGTRGIRALLETADDGHIKVHVGDPAMQAAFSGTAAAGEFSAPPAGDLLSVVQNNGAANKVDYYLDRTVRYSVRLLEDGTATATTEVLLENRVPDRETSKYVIGPNVDFAEAGENISIVNVYCGTCRLTSAARNGEPFDPGTDTEAGSRFYQDYVRIPRGDDVEIEMAYALEGVWTGTRADGVYQLTFLNQTTIRDPRLSVEIRVPDGTEVVRASEGTEVRGDVVAWEGVPGVRVDIEVAFSTPYPGRLWIQLTDLFTDR